MACRREVVTELTDMMLDAMVEHSRDNPDISADETIAAAMSLALRVLKGAKAVGASPQKLRAGVEVLLMECVDDGAKAN